MERWPACAYPIRTDDINLCSNHCNPRPAFESVAHDENVLAPYQFKNLGGSDGDGNHRIDRRLCDLVYGKREHAVSKPGHAGRFPEYHDVRKRPAGRNVQWKQRSEK